VGSSPFLIAATSTHRPEYLRRVLDSWSKVRGVDRYRWLVRQEPGRAADLCREVFTESGFEFEWRVNVKREGPLWNPWLAIDECFDLGSRFVIYAEDDVVVSPDVIEFMEWAQSEYEDQKVLAVSAMQRQRTGFGDPDWHRAIWTKRFPANVFGIWDSRWKLITREWDFDYRKRGWDWALTDFLVHHEWWTVAPAISRSDHIGKHGGAHMPPAAYDRHRPEKFAGQYREGTWHE
jgi:hypothetical protein